MLELSILKEKAINLLCKLVETQSFSGEEDQTANIIFNFLTYHNANVYRQNNNIWSIHRGFDKEKKTILLNSHHDTVRYGSSWTYEALKATIEGDKLIGLGSNDAGASVVSLLATYIHFLNQELPYNLIIAITAEEENSGKNNVASILPYLPKIDLGIVGEPTQMDMAIAERGLIVIDATVKGKTGHAARSEGINAISEAIEVVNWFHNYKFQRISDLLGPVKMTVTQINAGKQHNVVPDECNLVIDCRTNELYTNQEIIDVIRNNLTNVNIHPRSLRLNSSRISKNHPIIKKGIELGSTTYGSPTMSDQAFMSFETVKMGPGNSERSHTPNEYIYLSEIEHGIERYIDLLNNFLF